MQRYYISYPFTGDEKKTFAEAEKIRLSLKKLYPDICFINPYGMFWDEHVDYYTALADAIEFLAGCDAIILCPGWKDSCGCRIEKSFAFWSGIRIFYLVGKLEQEGTE